MARTFGGASTDKIVTNLTSYSTQRTYSVWVYLTGAGGGNLGRIFDKRVSGSQTELMFVDSSSLHYERDWSSANGNWRITNPALNAWHHVAVTYDSSSASNVPTMYMDGVSQSVTADSSPAGTPNTTTDAYVLGNRANDNGRNFAGRLADFGVWNRLLTAAEITAVMAHGVYSLPDYTLWVPIWGLASPEPEFRPTSAASDTVTGTTAADHCPIRPLSSFFWGGFNGVSTSTPAPPASIVYLSPRSFYQVWN